MALAELRQAVEELAEQAGAPVFYKVGLQRWRAGVDAYALGAKQVNHGR